MARANVRIRVSDEGLLEVIDPGLESLDLLRSIDPNFNIEIAPLTGFTSPRFLQLRGAGCGIAHGLLSEKSEDALWKVHSQLMSAFRMGALLPGRKEDEASLLELKIEITRRVLSHCYLCAHNCGINRMLGELGVCKLGLEAVAVEHFVHIAEESPINPSLALNLAGCALRCRFCQQYNLLDPRLVSGEMLDSELWSRLETHKARSLSFIGGNPDESLYSVLRFLAAAPEFWELPIVWNCHGYATVKTAELLEGAVDVFVPDYKYGANTCGERLSGISNYPETARNAVAAMLAQNVPVIVRILVLPGHFECCNAPVLESLAGMKRPQLLVSARGQYCPDWKITDEDGDLARRITHEELTSVVNLARSLGLNLVS